MSKNAERELRVCFGLWTYFSVSQPRKYDSKRDSRGACYKIMPITTIECVAEGIVEQIEKSLHTEVHGYRKVGGILCRQLLPFWTLKAILEVKAKIPSIEIWRCRADKFW